jgi:NADH-quinone oxidoreductase subunit F
MKKGERILLKEKFATDIKEYISKGGFNSLQKILGGFFSPEDVIEEVKKSGLRGRGGAGFPTGLKWSFIPRNKDVPKYLVCNADEGEPGTFKDREILFKAPFLLIEGMTISSYAIGAEISFIYLRKEYEWILDTLKSAIEAAEKENFLGKNILGTDFTHYIKIFVGAGAYICGEETALLESMEGKRGLPRLKPPFPATEGLFGYPTCINNVETLANIPIIFEIGGENYAKIGTSKSTGTRLVCVSGIVKNPGVYEIEQGRITVKEIIFELAGGIKEGWNFKGVFPGGISTPPLTSEELDVPFDFESLEEKGSAAGSGAIIVFGYKNSEKELFKVLKRAVHFFKEESCGKCTPCREGTRWIYTVLEFIEKKEISFEKGLDMVKEIAGKIKGLCACPLGETCAETTDVFLKKYGVLIKS